MNNSDKSYLYIVFHYNSPEPQAEASPLGQSLFLVFVPPPQDEVHGDHSVHDVHWGQELVEQSSSSKAFPSQTSCPFRIVGVEHSRARCRLPPPQVTEQVDHSDQGVNAGQGSLLQSSVSFLLPPSPQSNGSSDDDPSSKMHSRIFVLEPPPQETLHSVQSDQSVHLGHSFSLHPDTSSRASLQGLSLIPTRSSLQSRTLLLLPPPQDWEHVVQSDQGVRVGQSADPQVSSISESPRQAVSLLEVLGSRHCLTFFLVPPPQDLEHAVHSVQSVHSGQGFWLQSSVKIRSALHGLPSLSRWLTHSRILVLVPPPQDLEHSLQPDHSLGAGQGLLLQSDTTSRSPGQRSWSRSHPRALGKTHSLVLTFLPPPQDTEQGVHSVQSVQTGQASVLQDLTSLRSPSQTSSSNLGKTQSRILCWVPPPQDKEHSVQLVHSVQIGQSFVLHSSVNLESPWHNVVSPDLGTKHSRTLLRIPPPQVLVQTVQSDHSDQYGQSWLLQLSFSSGSPKQALLSIFPVASSMHCRNLLLWPPEQDLEQDVHSPQGPHWGHFWLLHSSITSRGPWQGLLSKFRPGLCWTHFRLFCRNPPPQVSEHVDL